MLQGMTGDSMFQKRLDEIKSMPPGPEKEAAMAALSRDYPGELQKLNEQYGVMKALMQQNTPRGQVAGNNPYSVYVGRGGEALLGGVQKGLAGREMRKIDRERDEMSQQKQGATRALLESGLQQRQAQMLRGGGGTDIPHGMPGHQCPPGLTPEQCMQRSRMMQQGGMGMGSVGA